MASSKLAAGDAILATKLNEITMGSTAPLTPVQGWVWLDTSVSGTPLVWQYNGTTWVSVGGANAAYSAFLGADF